MGMAALFRLSVVYAMVFSPCVCGQTEVTITSDPALPVSLVSDLTLTCNVHLIDVVSITWTNSRVIGTSNQLTTNLSAGTSTLIIPTVHSADLGEYTCTGSNGGISSYSSSINVTASVSVSRKQFIPEEVPFFTGTQGRLFCFIYVSPSLKPEITFNLIVESSYEKDGMKVFSQERVTTSNLAYFSPIPDLIAYRSTLTITPMVRTTDIGKWTCRINFSSDNIFIISSSVMESLYIHETNSPALFFSIPTALVDPPLVSVPDVYNEAIVFTCTGTVPKKLLVNMEIVWIVNGVETTIGVSATSNPRGRTSVSELRPITLGNIGTYNCTCRVSVAVEGDPVQQDEASALLSITGPAIPNPPMGLNALNVEYSATTITWVVTEIAYSMESYVVRYGTDMNNLMHSSNPVRGGTDLTATNQQFVTRIEDLRPGVAYYFVVDAINIEGTTSSLPANFTTPESPPTAPPSNFFATDIGYTYIQFSWRSPPSQFPIPPIVNFTLDCTPSTPGLSLPHTYQLQNESLTENQSQKESLTENQQQQLAFNESGGFEANITTFMPETMYTCSVLATNRIGDSPLAIIHVTTLQQPTSMIPTTSSNKDITTETEFEENNSNIAVIAGGAAAAFFSEIVIIITVVMIIVMWRRRKKRIKELEVPTHGLPESELSEYKLIEQHTDKKDLPTSETTELHSNSTSVQEMYMYQEGTNLHTTESPAPVYAQLGETVVYSVVEKATANRR